MEIITTTAKNTTITMDVETEIIPASTLAKIFDTSTEADRTREFARRVKETKDNLEKDITKKINMGMLKGERYISITIEEKDKPSCLLREDVCEVCEKVIKKYESKGYTVRGKWTYSKNYYKIYGFTVYL